MQKIRFFSLLALWLWFPTIISAQSFNWGNLNPERPLTLQLSAGLEHGIVFGTGITTLQNFPLFPVVSQVEFSVPYGEDILDDFKIKLGGQINWWHSGSWNFSTKIQGVFRRYQQEFVRLVNFGSDLGGTFGYYRPHGFIAAEVGFDKAIVTHFKHAEVYYTIHPEVVDGWYEPSTGGNFYYGIQTGLSLSRIELVVRAGKMLPQDFRTELLFPLYAQLGLNLNF